MIIIKELILLPIIFLIFMIISIILTGFTYNQWKMCYNNLLVLGLWEIVSLLLVIE